MNVIGFAGWSGSGKTTLIETVIGILTTRGFSVSLIKHAHHRFDIDHEGKDSWRHRQAGCREVMISSERRWSLTHELKGDNEPTLHRLLEKLSPCDLVLVEGFKKAELPKIEVYRAGASETLLFPTDKHIIAIATDAADPAIQQDTSLPVLDINNPIVVAHFIIAHFQLEERQHCT